MKDADVERQDFEVDRLLALLVQPDLSLEEMEQVLAGLEPGLSVPWERIEDRLFAALETAENPTVVETEPGTRVALHDAALILLTYLGDEKVVPRLLSLIDRESLPDAFKLKLIGAVHEFDPERNTDLLLNRLRNPQKAVQQSYREHLRRLQSPLELGLWLDVMAEEMLPEARADFVRSSVDIAEPLAVPMLICMCYDEDPDVALAAIDAVERYKDARALPVLEELAARHPLAAVRTEASKTVDRLRVRASLVPQAEPVAPVPLGPCYLTTIGGMGGQVALLVRETSPEMLRVAQVAFSDEIGIEYCFGMDVSAGELYDLLDELADQGLSPVDVPYAELIQALEMASEATWHAGRLLPASFVAWREWITWEWTHGGEAAHRAATGAGPSDAQLFLGALPAYQRERLLQDSHELLFQDEFTYWLFDEDEVQDLGPVFWELVEENQGNAPEVSAVRDLLRAAVRRIVTDHVRGQIRDRLQRVAPLLHDLYVDDEVWKWAVVAADALADDSPLPPEEHPLLLAMAAHSLETIVDAEVRWRNVGEGA